MYGTGACSCVKALFLTVLNLWVPFSRRLVADKRKSSEVMYHDERLLKKKKTCVWFC
jgi:hypothetical protein